MMTTNSQYTHGSPCAQEGEESQEATQRRVLARWQKAVFEFGVYQQPGSTIQDMAKALIEVGNALIELSTCLGPPLLGSSEDTAAIDQPEESNDG